MNISTIDNNLHDRSEDTVVSRVSSIYRTIYNNLPGSIHLLKHQTILENPGTDVGRQYAMLFHFAKQLICVNQK